MTGHFQLTFDLGVACLGGRSRFWPFAEPLADAIWDSVGN